jgi:hypothetical protein
LNLEDIGIINKDTFEKTSLDQIKSKGYNFLLAFTFDHGSIIPQIHFDSNDLDDRVSYARTLPQKILNLKIKSNLQFPFLKPFYNDNYNVEINFSNGYTVKDLIRSIIFPLIKHDYISDNVRIINIK